MMVVLAFPTIMVEVGIIAEVNLMFSVEPVMIMVIIDLIAIMSMPSWVAIIGITRISLFVDANGDMNLCAGGIDGERGRDDGGQNE